MKATKSITITVPIRPTLENSPELKALCEYGFTATDLQLFIDVNPDCEKAIARYNETVANYNIAKENYEKKHGPIRNFVCNSPNAHFDYIKSPWPWE